MPVTPETRGEGLEVVCTAYMEIQPTSRMKSWKENLTE